MLVTEWKPSGEAPKLQPNPTWKAIVEPVKPFLEKVAQNLVAQVDEFDPGISHYVRYALSNQGKQIRPALAALSGAAFGSVNDELLKAAVIIEMVHLATLVHDDVMDEATVRRSRPTLSANWGNEISVLVGDCLFAHALALAASFPTPDVCRAVAQATNTVCTGEILQTNQRRNFHLSREDYLKALGTAYQLYDDCLDLFGSEKEAGKSLGTDLGTGKITLPILIILESGTNSDRLMLQNCIESLEPNDMEKIFELLTKYDALSGTQSVVQQYIKSAQLGLGQLRPSKGVEALAALGEYLAQQCGALGVN